VFTAAKVSALLGLAFLGVALGRNAHALAANFQRHFWRNAGLGGAARGKVGWRAGGDGEHTDDSGGGAGWIVVLGGCVEQRHVFTAGESEESPNAICLVAGVGTGVVIAL